MIAKATSGQVLITPQYSVERELDPQRRRFLRNYKNYAKKLFDIYGVNLKLRDVQNLIIALEILKLQNYPLPIKHLQNEYSTSI